MTRTSYQERLRALRGDVGAMADTVLDQYRDAVTVLESGDERAAEAVVRDDERINEWYLDVEADCIELFALQQPVAGDLRFITSTFKIATDLERIGDLAVNLAEYGREAGGDVEGIDIEPIAREAGDMVEAAMDAYAVDDAETARQVAGRDDDLDRQCREASEDVFVGLLGTDPARSRIDELLQDVSRTLLTIRDIERVGDHAVNICARTVYMVEHDDELLY
jgi:phosphate transport system protein